MCVCVRKNHFITLVKDNKADFIPGKQSEWFFVIREKLDSTPTLTMTSWDLYLYQATWHTVDGKLLRGNIRVKREFYLL